MSGECCSDRSEKVSARLSPTPRINGHNSEYKNVFLLSDRVSVIATAVFMYLCCFILRSELNLSALLLPLIEWIHWNISWDILPCWLSCYAVGENVSYNYRSNRCVPCDGLSIVSYWLTETFQAAQHGLLCNLEVVDHLSVAPLLLAASTAYSIVLGDLCVCLSVVKLFSNCYSFGFSVVLA